MSLFDGKPIGRIEIGARPDPNEGRCSVCGSRGMEDYCSRATCPPFLGAVSMSPVEAERIWRLVRAAAEGSNVADPVETETWSFWKAAT